MQHIRLIHWNAVEAEERARRLRNLGYNVDFSTFDPAAWRTLRQHPPAVVVIDLSRLPSQGRDVGLGIRKYKDTRHVPIVFVEGDPEKVARIQKLLPDAAYTTWTRIRGALKRAVARPPSDPVVPRSNLAGYSGTPLVKKLGIKANSMVALVGAPQDFETTLGDLPEGVKLRRGARGKRDLTIWFTRSRKEFEGRIDRMATGIEAGGLWVVWPKKTSDLAGDLSQPLVRQIGLAAGLVDYKVCAIDDTWSGLKFSRRKSK
jgi:CheY-like chemotaxis protein